VLERLSTAGVVSTTAAFLARHPPRQFVRLVENSSWGCAHGVSAGARLRVPAEG
jgi:hypothetical protein